MSALATSPLPSGGAQQWGKIRNGLHLSGWTTSPPPFGALQQGDKIRNALHVAGLATSPLPSSGSPTRGQNQKWPKRGRTGCITPAVWGVTKKWATTERDHRWAYWLHHPYRMGGPPQGGKNQKKDHMWVDWLHHPCRLGGPPQRGKIKKGPHVGGLATSPLPFGGSRSSGPNPKWLTCGWIGYITPAL